MLEVMSIDFIKCSLNTDTINVMIAVTVTDTMKVTADAITATATVDNPELPVRYVNKAHEMICVS